jgi:hypothetical protein
MGGTEPPIHLVGTEQCTEPNPISPFAFRLILSNLRGWWLTTSEELGHHPSA